MSKLSKIGWTGPTWNPFIGCRKVTAMCDNCYMFRIVERWGGNPTQVKRSKSATFNKPLTTKQPSVFFTSSLTDIFHPDIDPYRKEIWDIIEKCPHHIFQILTKRPGRIKDHLPKDWYYNSEKWKHVWLGTSIGGDVTDKIMVEKLCENDASVLFLSCEPLIGHIEDALLTFISAPSSGAKWVIIGGESGNGKIPNDPEVKYKYRESEIEYFKTAINVCDFFGVPVFVKQLGKDLAKRLGAKTPNGADLEDLPYDLQVRQFPIDLSNYICNNI